MQDKLIKIHPSSPMDGDLVLLTRQHVLAHPESTMHISMHIMNQPTSHQVRSQHTLEPSCCWTRKFFSRNFRFSSTISEADLTLKQDEPKAKYETKINKDSQGFRQVTGTSDQDTSPLPGKAWKGLVKDTRHQNLSNNMKQQPSTK